ncbi:putative TRMT1-like protein [Scophthalmus maximus]|uniref:tRNA (guanine(26)-N(2))-dimethyltransferase n=1 Tax=Scophthalmus maximus TaxID=52904 RepID=A0A2U9C1L3_SCOMX|nr:putative TRMT1-like protein [Scophthalmus maximus]
MAALAEADAAPLHQEDVDTKPAERAAESEAAADDDAKPSTTTSTTERHVSIQTQLDGLETLVDLNGAGRKSCPLCPEEKFKACYSHKLRRHLQNLHWKVYVEFEGQRMCICHLPCRNLKPGGDQASGRHVAHYHCVVCSVTIARKTDMMSHLKRHVNKGETEASYSGSSDVPCEEPAPSGQPYEIMKELGTNVQLLPNHTTPQKSDTYFNRKMKTNRQLVFCSLAVLAEERNPLECLDAFGATGIMGLQWAKHLRTAVKVTITDISDTCVKMIKENCQLNHIRWRGPRGPDGAGGEVEGTPIALVEVAKMDANVIMHLRPFDFIHLDPFGTAVNYLDAAFRNVRNLGIISVTSTDTGSLYAKSPNVTLRHYGCNLVRTEYYRELAARMVVAAVARSGRLSGPSPLSLLVGCLFSPRTLLLFLAFLLSASAGWDWRRPPSGPARSQARLPVDFFSLRADRAAGFAQGIPFAGGRVPVRIGRSLVCDLGVVQRLCLQGVVFLSAVECGVVIKTLQSGEEAGPDQSGKRKSGGEESGSVLKKLKSDASLEHPPFYYSIHRHSIRGMNMPKLNRFLQYLTDAGFRVSRTHFDPTGVRTDASLEKFKSVLTKYSVPTYTNTTAAETSVSSEKTE